MATKLPAFEVYVPGPLQRLAYEVGRFLGKSEERLRDWIYSDGYEPRGVPLATDEQRERMVADDRVCVFFEAGRWGCPLPKWRYGWRWGKIPASGYSRNWADNVSEAGVSCMWVQGDDWNGRGGSFEIFNRAGRSVTWVAGWFIEWRRGSDGEPLLAAPVYISRPREAPRFRA